MVTVIGRFFYVMYLFRNGFVYSRKLSAKLTERLTPPLPLKGTSPYTEVLFGVKPHVTHYTEQYIEVRSYIWSTNSSLSDNDFCNFRNR